jgi:hypothetical protein
MNRTFFIAAVALFTAAGLSAADATAPAMVSPPSALSIYQAISYSVAFVAFTASQRTAANGLVGENRPGWLSVEYQRGVMQPMTFGVINNLPSIVSNEWLAIDTAFSYQRPDGGFTYAPVIAGVTEKPTQEPSNDAFFLAETVTPFLLLGQDLATGPIFEPRLQAMLPALAAAIKFIERPSSISAMESNDTKATNRVAIDAKALLLNGLLIQDNVAVNAGRLLLTQVLVAQEANGVFPEDGGYDSSYQSVTLLKLCEIYTFDRDPAVLLALQSGFAWESARVLSTGQIDTTGDSRVGPGGEIYFGIEKQVNYPEVIRAFALYGAITGNSSYSQASVQILQYYSANPTE